MGRYILSVVIGFIIWTALWLGSNAALQASMPNAFEASGTTSNTSILVGILGIAILVSLVSGYITMIVAAGKSMTPVAVLGVVLLAVGVFVQMQYWNIMPIWYHLSFLAALLPCSVIGGLMRLRMRQE
ncbi:MAG: hypothetical protein DHS20C16_29790 [Phycisphaerae bacterium]|nr:MAG: hypothetical protein DHS20C16_29790 [Phycisphaerae bacterium]